MKTIVILLLFPMIVWSQDGAVKHRFYYKTSINDSILKNYADVFLLNISDQVTEFKSVQHLVPAEGMTVIRTEGRVMVSGSPNPAPKNFVRGRIYRDRSAGKFKTIETLINEYLITDSIPVIAWDILPDTATIGGLACQKAMGIVYGKTYTVFFAKEIPLPYGPWQLGGLPGLIVSAQDEGKEYTFELTLADAETVKKNVGNLILPAGRVYKQVNKKEYLQYVKLYQENFDLYSQMQMGDDIKVVYKDNASRPAPRQLAKLPLVVPLFARMQMMKFEL